MKLCVLWYFRYPLSYRNVAEMMAIRGVAVSHQSVFRWVDKLGNEFGEKARNLHGVIFGKIPRLHNHDI